MEVGYYFDSEVLQDFEKALEDSDDYNVIIKAGEYPDVKELRAHSFVLRARYLYTGTVDYDQLHEDVILQLSVAADELGLIKLIDNIQEYLIENQEFLRKDPVGTLEFVYQHETLKTQKDCCLKIISSDPKILFASQKFSSLEKPIITMVLQRDDLKMEEIEIWEAVLRWLFVHYLKIGKDESSWSSDDLTNVKQTIQEYIPFIRFHDISKEDFYLKVYPYKDLLPQDLLSDILRYHLAPNSTPAFSFKASRNPRKWNANRIELQRRDSLEDTISETEELYFLQLLLPRWYFNEEL
ncbi:13614_t:CDS:2 [Funneliformis geosporum]|uniref:13614_t:CDS:1 n=1 Tax=Funneliformis geosporum TaxID=1117311 RepID=A0A9W4SL17_9GLOM|nr:13614_t:CDS:2 [Funneliformis geosporum]